MPMLNIGSIKQLFFDDYLIESLVNAKQGLNPAVKVDDNPLTILSSGRNVRGKATSCDPSR